MGWPGPMTHRQYLVWTAWLEEEWNRPDRADHYAMLVAAEIRRLFRKNPGAVKLDHLKIKFVDKDAPAYPGLTPEEATAVAKAIWHQKLGINDGNGNREPDRPANR